MHSMRGKDAVGVEHAVDAIELHDPHQIELNLGLPSLRDRGTGASHARARVLETPLLLQGGQGRGARRTDDDEEIREGEGNGMNQGLPRHVVIYSSSFPRGGDEAWKEGSGLHCCSIVSG
jgi:hypothetical protein